MNFRQVHLDFHTSEKIPRVGDKFDKKQFQAALKAGHVNSITVFAKCHHGWAYFNSEANEMHPALNGFELLTAEIEAAHEIGVKAPIYISAGLDEKMARRHPEWLFRNIDESTSWVKSFDKPGYHLFCFNSPYLDYLCEQAKEVCIKYKDMGVDGLFFDISGEKECYCQNCMNTLIKEGKDPYDPKNVKALGRRTYANYTKRIREAVDEIDPSIRIFHNAGHIKKGRRELAYMDTHLELESLPTGGWGYDHFPLSAKYVQQLGMDYLGMTGKFHRAWGEFGGFKHPNALRYECALSAANGAKCSVGDQLHPSGKADMVTYELIGAAYSEIEEKEPWLDNVSSVADIGLLSYEACTDTLGYDYAGNSNNFDVGAGRILLEGHYLFDILDLESDFSKYKVIVLPDAIKIEGTIKAKLDEFLKQGGKLLATGVSGLYLDRDEFAFDFGVKYEGVCELKPNYMHPSFTYENIGDTAYLMNATCYNVSLTDEGKEYAKAEKTYFNRTVEHFSSHRHTSNSMEFSGVGVSEGKDGMYIAWNIFLDYAENAMLAAKRTVQFALDTLLKDGKTVETSLYAQGVTTLMDQKDSSRYVSHILYASPVKRGKGIEVIEDIIPVYNVEMTYKTEKKIKNAYLAPQMQKLEFTEKGGKISLTVPKLDCHQMIVLDY